MIKNDVRFCTLEELSNNSSIVLKDWETVNIFINGKDAPKMSDTIRIIFDELNIKREIYKNFLFMQAIDFMMEIFDLSDRYITQINIIISNYDTYHREWIIDDKEATYDFYKNICDYYEDEVVMADLYGSRKSVDVYFCREDFDIEEFKRNINFPSKFEVLERIQKKRELSQKVESRRGISIFRKKK